MHTNSCGESEMSRRHDDSESVECDALVESMKVYKSFSDTLRVDSEWCSASGAVWSYEWSCVHVKWCLMGYFQLRLNRYSLRSDNWNVMKVVSILDLSFIFITRWMEVGNISIFFILLHNEHQLSGVKKSFCSLGNPIQTLNFSTIISRKMQLKL